MFASPYAWSSYIAASRGDMGGGAPARARSPGARFAGAVLTIVSRISSAVTPGQSGQARVDSARNVRTRRVKPPGNEAVCRRPPGPGTGVIITSGYGIPVPVARELYPYLLAPQPSAVSVTI
jgi:hypothetical protein